MPRIFESFVWNQRDKALEQGKELAKQIEATHPAVAQRLMTVLTRVLMPVRVPPALPLKAWWKCPRRATRSMP